ncbi:MAG TPA: prolyl aminopeptidase [Gallionella sp.]|nr:prolyl aminopeptidase [Gallionella sp.]
MEKSSETLVFAAIEPFETGLIQTGSAHQFYYEVCGNPSGIPILVLHGGPGSGCNPGQRRFFDPSVYKIILFDQRGCGRSLPPGHIEHNTTDDLVEDIERLRRHLGIDQWLLFGGSWGSTLALAYATTYPQRVRGLILRGIFLARPSELHWFLYEARTFFPEAWEQLVAPLPEHERQDILAAYCRRVFSDDHATSIAAARNWGSYEGRIISLLPPSPADVQPLPDEITLARARVQLHYLAHDCFLLETPLLDRVQTLRKIPTAIVHGRYDMVCPIISAYELHQAWPEADFQVIPDAGHASFEAGIAAALLAATHRFRSI